MSKILEMVERTSVQHHDKINRIAKHLQSAGIRYVCFQYVSNQGLWFTLGNDPEWLMYCAENKYYQHDPSLLSPSMVQSSIKLPKLYDNDAFQDTLVNNAECYFDINHPLAICEKTSKGCYYYFLATTKENRHIVEYYLQYSHFLSTTFANFAKEQLKDIWRDCMESSVDLKEFNLEQFLNKNSNLFTLDTPHPLSKGELFHAITRLSNKELECINLYKQGLTAKESAKILNVSNRTIEDRFESIKDKLNLQTKREILALPI